MADTNSSSNNSCCAPTSSIPDQELTSAVDFETEVRPHISLNVFDLRKSLAFYMAFFNQKPVKLKEDYAKFELSQPPVNFTLNVHEDNYDQDTEYGLQMYYQHELDDMRERLAKIGYELQTADNGFYIRDPEGNRWEIYH